MSTTEARERQTRTMKIIRVLTRFKTLPAPQNWLIDPPANFFLLYNFQNFLSKAYRKIFTGLTYDRTRRTARFSRNLIEETIAMMVGENSITNEVIATNEDCEFAFNWDARVLGLNVRTWVIAIDENSQQMKLFEVYHNPDTNEQSARVPKLPEHIALASPPANSYFLITLFNYISSEETRILEILLGKLK